MEDSRNEDGVLEPMCFRRVMACWNACEGISTESLEAGVVKGMLEVLEGVVAECDSPDNGRYLRWAIGEARFVIFKATGKTQ